jgi:hypothetical protein
LSIFNFSTRFFAQIVENRETQLSSPFLGPGDIFSKSYDENQIWSKCSGRAAAARGSDAQISGAIQLPYESVFVITFIYALSYQAIFLAPDRHPGTNVDLLEH